MAFSPRSSRSRLRAGSIWRGWRRCATPSFDHSFVLKMILCQDRLGTNIGKALKKEGVFRRCLRGTSDVTSRRWRTAPLIRWEKKQAACPLFVGSPDENEGCGFAKTGSGHDEGRLKTNKWRFLAAALAGRQAFPLHEEGAGRGDDGAQQVRQEKSEITPFLSNLHI